MGGNRPPLAGRRGSRGDHSEGPPLRAFGFFPRARKETPRRRGGLREGRQSYPPAGTAPAEAEYSSFYPRNLSVSFAESFPRGKPIRAAGKTFAAAGNGELRQDTDQHPEKPFNIACSAVRDGRLTSRTRLFSAAPMPPLLQRPPHRGAGAEPRRALSPVSLAQEKPGRRRPLRNGPHRLPRRRKSHGLRIRGCRKSRECLLAFDCSSSSNRSGCFDLRYGGYG